MIVKIKNKVKNILRNPYKSARSNKKIIHSCYHKVGTVWFSRILRHIASYYGLSFQKCHPNQLKSKTKIFFDDHSLVDFSKFNNYIGSHMIRDPRDVIISGYFYHLKTTERWVHIPKAEYNNLSFQEYLNSLDQEKGILTEIERAQYEINAMADWDYKNPNIYEIMYEDIILDEEKYFVEIFSHYGFNDKAISKSLEIAMSYSLKNIKKKKYSHSRSGKPGDWKNYFTNHHKDYFKEICGDTLIKLGYEYNSNW